MVKVEMYAKMGCPHCAKARDLFASKCVNVVEHDITMGGESRKEMLRWRGPGVHVGRGGVCYA